MLDDFGAFPAMIEAELRRYLPFLVSTKVLITAVRHGVGRETAHEVIRDHAVAVALRMRETGSGVNDLLDRLAADPRLGVTRDELETAVRAPLDLAGTAGTQVATVVQQIAELAAVHPEAAAYEPGYVP